MFKHIPNILTIIRFLLIPFIVFCIFNNEFIWAFVFFTISGITDVADGFIARKFNLVSNFGKLMDPLADKLTQIATLASLVIVNIIPLWILIIVLVKEFIMIVGASFLYGKDVVVYSKWYGKLATVLFYVAIVLSLMLRQLNVQGFWQHTDLICYSIALIATIFALIMYVKSLYTKGFIDKEDLKKDVTIDKK
ncbi:MAG: CDP-diacylglycerol--glycerol-3-phosphate 3-phosphatidyltransferase [Clostridia bacterium]|nr:CDP-diacylglycerol--glycerol-3-phosphate 3-phosphatidyltransferase [Clostridia bacterium]MBP3800807.1 CDP-diacylglycerol--glycerol-3-phosphate 3-phosphatidyltransferase [Clostridia bacterium]